MIDRRSFLGSSTLAAASILTAGTFTRALAQDTRGALASGVVNTTAGKVQGIVRDGVNAFHGVPYGMSTANGGRFMPPVKPEPWTGEREMR